MRLGKNQQKILILLLGGICMGLSRSPKYYFKTAKAIGGALKDVDRRAIDDAIKNLYKSKLIDQKYNRENGTTTFILTEKGKKKAIAFNLDKMKIKKPKTWDKKWRIVIFDIPEKLKKVREAVRMHLKNMDFCELQKSVFVHPYDCKDEIEYIIEFYNIRKFIRFIVADSIDNELHLKKEFRLI